MEYIFMIYLFDVVDVNIIFYKFGQNYYSLTLDKNGFLMF
jgi:hypothetical protein